MWYSRKHKLITEGQSVVTQSLAQLGSENCVWWGRGGSITKDLAIKCFWPCNSKKKKIQVKIKGAIICGFLAVLTGSECDLTGALVLDTHCVQFVPHTPACQAVPPRLLQAPQWPVKTPASRNYRALLLSPRFSLQTQRVYGKQRLEIFFYHTELVHLGSCCTTMLDFSRCCLNC